MSILVLIGLGSATSVQENDRSKAEKKEWHTLSMMGNRGVKNGGNPFGVKLGGDGVIKGMGGLEKDSKLRLGGGRSDADLIEDVIDGLGGGSGSIGGNGGRNGSCSNGS